MEFPWLNEPKILQDHFSKLYHTNNQLTLLMFIYEFGLTLLQRIGITSAELKFHSVMFMICFMLSHVLCSIRLRCVRLHSVALRCVWLHCSLLRCVICHVMSCHVMTLRGKLRGGKTERKKH